MPTVFTENARFISLVDSLTRACGKFSGQRHMSAIRESFIALMPLIIAASCFILLNNVILQPQNGILAWLGIDGVWADGLRGICIRVNNGTLNILSYVTAVTIADKLAKSYDEDGMLYGVVALITLFPLQATVTSAAGEILMAQGAIGSDYTGASGMFVGIFTSIISTELLRRVSRQKWLTIIMPESVPPAVVRSFNVLIPMIIVLAFFGAVGWGLQYFFDKTLQQLVNDFIQTPLQNILQNAGGMVILLLVQNLFWWMGIHSTSIMYPVTEPTLIDLLPENSTSLN